MNGDSYRVILNEFLFTKIEEEDIGNIWFQQDSATCHTAEATPDVLRPDLLSAAELMSFGQLGAVFCHRWAIICRVLSKISVTPTSQRQLTL